ncbi:hypothetical protein NE237_031174 [Protea cynaroides]|uniref:NmrA-like domain-containing protein n=1 Tax=Protea cynaroides TaxID=273540 RepID=A0A9Q0R290_9MAGN|nr:hypothetical protein NE237_031174 [Protea cynaroides]
MAAKSKILIIGGTGYIGKFIVEASLKSGHPTFALVRESTASDPVDVVICTVGHAQREDQVKIIAAIKEDGNIKSVFASVARIRRTIEAEGIPYTYVSCNSFAGYFWYMLTILGDTAPPREKVSILGDGNPKAVFNKEEDIATYTIRAVDDPRTLNKILYVRPPPNIFSFNEFIALWENKIGKTLEKIYVTEEQILKNIQG